MNIIFDVLIVILVNSFVVVSQCLIVLFMIIPYSFSKAYFDLFLVARLILPLCFHRFIIK
jgi:hypothetical protein